MRVTLFLRGRPGLPQFVANLANQRPEERQHLSHEEYKRRFGLRFGDLLAVARFARNNGLQILNVHEGKRTVELGGPAAAFSRAFGVRLGLYASPRGVLRGQTGPISVPAWLAPTIEGVLGFDERPVARPHFRTAGVIARGFEGARPKATFDPTQVADLYDFPESDGSGQCVGIIELGGGYTPIELEQYFSELKISPIPQVEAISVAGGTNRPIGNPNSADGEVCLDIEIVGAIAPAARIAVYFTPNTDQGFAEAIMSAVHDTQRNPSVISISWGQPEELWSGQSRRVMNQAFWGAAAMGVTVFAAAGDSGSGDGLPGGKAHVDFPASSPLVIGCGGTTLNATMSTITSEVVWNNPGGGATGGGVSRVFPVPSYQNSVQPISAGVPPHTGRGVPDVSGNADPNTGYRILVDGQLLVFGGTSAVAPLWSALLVRMQEQLNASAAPLLPNIYQMPTGFRDITRGENGAYSAKVGWDACTGLGSPDGTALLAALQSSASPPQIESASGHNKRGRTPAATAQRTPQHNLR